MSDMKELLQREKSDRELIKKSLAVFEDLVHHNALARHATGRPLVVNLSGLINALRDRLKQPDLRAAIAKAEGASHE